MAVPKRKTSPSRRGMRRSAHHRPQRALTGRELAEGVAHVVFGAEPEFLGIEAACLRDIVSRDDGVNETLDHESASWRSRPR